MNSVSFSRDGQWAAYSTPLGLWRSRVDGSDRQQLTFLGTAAWKPRWSPDGTWIAFIGSRRLYLVPSGGGDPKPVTPEGIVPDDPGWSPDGMSLVFSVRTPGVAADTWHICTVDLKTRQVSRLPGSEGLRGPAYSPDGTYLVAGEGNSPKLMLFDIHSRRWTKLVQAAYIYGDYWSRDSRYVYYQELLGSADQPIYRIRISDRKVELVATRKQFVQGEVKAFSLQGVAPDGSPVVSLLRAEDNLYAFDVDFP